MFYSLETAGTRLRCSSGLSENEMIRYCCETQQTEPYLVLSGPLPLVLLLLELLPGESVLVTALHHRPDDAVSGWPAGETHHLPPVVPPAQVVRPHELGLRPPQAVVRLLLDPVLYAGLVLEDGLYLGDREVTILRICPNVHLEEEQHSHGHHHTQGEAEAKQSSCRTTRG